MAYIEIDVDLDKFRDDDIISEFVYRYKKYYGEKFREKANIAINLQNPYPLFKIDSLADKMKLEFLESVFDKFTLEELEDRLKIK